MVSEPKELRAGVKEITNDRHCVWPSATPHLPSVPLLVLTCPTSADCPRCLCFLPTSWNTFLHRRFSQVKNNESTLHRLTQPSAFHFLRRIPKNGKDLDHDINNYVRHSRSRCNASVNLKPLEESFNAVKQVEKLVSASAGIFSCLRVKVSK